MRFLLSLLVFGIYFFFARWYFVCEVRNHCGEVEITTPAKPTRLNTLALMEGDSVLLEGYDEFSFPINKAKPDLNEDNLEFLEDVAKHLRENPDKELTIVGRFLNSETDKRFGIMENLGLARAGAIRPYLEGQGVDGKRIHLDHERVSGNKLDQPLAFVISDSTEPDDYENLQYRFEDMTYSEANFAFNSAEFQPKEAFVFYADSLKNFLTENPDFQIIVTGHTDTIASQAYNVELGLKRAKSAIDYFGELGIEAKMEAASKGRENPVAPNINPDGSDNPEGRAKNRRVNFKLEKIEAQ